MPRVNHRDFVDAVVQRGSQVVEDFAQQQIESIGWGGSLLDPDQPFPFRVYIDHRVIGVRVKVGIPFFAESFTIGARPLNALPDRVEWTFTHEWSRERGIVQKEDHAQEETYPRERGNAGDGDGSRDPDTDPARTCSGCSGRP